MKRIYPVMLFVLAVLAGCSKPVPEASLGTSIKRVVVKPSIN